MNDLTKEEIAEAVREGIVEARIQLDDRRTMLAGMALQALLTTNPKHTGLTAEQTPRVLAVAALMFADALLLELDKVKP